MRKVRTVADVVRIEGNGVFSGKSVPIKLLPAKEGTGIRFFRKDIAEGEVILASAEFLGPDSEHCTVLEKDGTQVRVTEHLMCALYLLGIRNLNVQLYGEELPSGDGSPSFFFQAIKKVGVVDQNDEWDTLEIERSLRVEEEGGYIELHPARDLSIDYTLIHPHPRIGRQLYRFEMSSEPISEILQARTFITVEEAKELMNTGLLQNTDLSAGIVVGDEGFSTELRFERELVCHKVGDFLGDFSLLGLDVTARIVCYKSGHKLNHRLLKLLSKEKKSVSSRRSNAHTPDE